jgi:hypothetical protein
MLTIKVLGSDGQDCRTIEERAQQAVAYLAADARVELVTDVKEIMRYRVMETPAIVINDKVVSTGRVPALSQMLTLITTALV